MKPRAFALALVLAVAGCGSSRAPGRTPVSLRLPAGAGVATSAVATRGGHAWFAIAIDRRLNLYRWQHDAWLLDGTLRLPDGLPSPARDGSLSSTDVGAAAAPSFTVHATGADTLWLALAARAGGRWQFVPFDDQFARRDPYTFASGASHGLIEGMFDSCGCAGGPTTSQWYRLHGGVFVPTEPRVGPAPCSARALVSADHWPRLPYDPLVRHIAQPFHVVHFACADGWALASNGRELSVYVQSGRTFNEPVGRDWLRVGVGSPRLIGASIDFAMSRSLLQRLGRAIGVTIAPVPPLPRGEPPTVLAGTQKAPIEIALRPGDAYAATGVPYDRPTRLTVTIRSQAGATTVTRFRWRNGAWVAF